MGRVLDLHMTQAPAESQHVAATREGRIVIERDEVSVIQGRPTLIPTSIKCVEHVQCECRGGSFLFRTIVSHLQARLCDSFRTEDRSLGHSELALVRECFKRTRRQRQSTNSCAW